MTLNWLDELLIRKMSPEIPFEVYTAEYGKVRGIGVRNLTSEIIVHYDGEEILYGPASYKDCCEFADDVRDVVFKRSPR